MEKRVRLQKYLADSGITSRRGGEKLILEGSVAVNGKLITKLGTTVNPEKDTVTVNGKRVLPSSKVYYLFYKPRGYTVTLDKNAEKGIFQFLKEIPERLIPVKGLDKSAEGLLLLTNDGEVANLLNRPFNSLSSVYRILVVPKTSSQILREIEKEGAWCSDGKLTVKNLRLLRSEANGSWLEVTTPPDEVKNHLRRLFAKYNFKVKRQIRVKLGHLSDKRIPVGAFRPLSDSEIASLKNREPCDVSSR
ncbi:MAG: S4 domain-containing protein [Planctomycetota bacterium]|nr:S4 domain-containing protein [Planctomycetota bacterium]